jgi:hypothetical protein
MAPGTARKPAAANSVSPQPVNLVATLSNQGPAPPVSAPITALGFRRNDSSTAFFSHWWTVQSFPVFSATRASPESSRARAASTASRTAPLVETLTSARASQAVSIVD